MRLSANPDLGSPRALGIAAIIVTGVACAVLAWQKGHIGASLGDTDDAMRIVIVRSLLAGHGWFDPVISRLQPPTGVAFHWSRLIDGGLAALIWLGERVTSRAQAELVVRFVWPLMWIFPAVVCGLSIAKSLGGRGAVMVTAVLMALTVQLYIQFVPGRVDHHNIQIVLILAAIAAALKARRRPGWAALSGAATGLGLAIGLESLLFHALVGAGFALRLARDRDGARCAGAYGVALAVSTATFFVLETAPSRWPLPFCDAIGSNVVAGVAVAGIGLALVAAGASRLTGALRLVLIVGVGAAAAGTFLAADPVCVRGPFAGLDPRVRPFWFDQIQETQPWPVIWAGERLWAIRQLVMALLTSAAAILLLVRGGKKIDNGLVVVCLLAAAAVATTFAARRMEAYLYWFGTPLLGAAISVAARAWMSDRLVPTLAAAVALSPGLVTDAAAGGADLMLGAARTEKPPAVAKCYASAAYAHLAALPAGLVISETDLGPFILASTADPALAAPYHRMSIGILAAHDILAAPPDRAMALARSAHGGYIVDCPPYPMGVGPASLGVALRRGAVPPWLVRLTTPRETLQIYQITEPGDHGRS